MRIAVRGETLLERLALRTGFAPLPAFQSLAGMGLSGVLVATARLGLVAELHRRSATAEELAVRLSLRAETVRLLLDALGALGLVRRRRDGRLTPTRRGRRWLLPDSPTSVARFVAGHQDHWHWWSGLADVARGGDVADHHSAAEDAPYWRDYITGQYELARFSAPELVAALRVPPHPRRVLDVGGGHGLFAAQLCRRHPGARATVVDLPGSVAAGRDIAAGAGYGHLVDHRAGDVRTADLGEGYDVALCLNLIHHLGPDEVPPVLRRLRAALRAGGTLAVLDLFREEEPRLPGRAFGNGSGTRLGPHAEGARTPGLRPRRPGASASCLGLLFHLSSGAGLYSPAQLAGWLTAAGFSAPHGTPLRRIPAQTLYQATALE